MFDTAIAFGFVRPYTGALILACSLLAPSVCFAQAGASDVGEVVVFGGGGCGNGTHPAVGASTGVAFSKWTIGLIEAAYMPMGGDTLRRQSDIHSVQDSHLFDFNAS